MEEVRQIFLQFDPSKAENAHALVMEHIGQEVSLLKSLKSDYFSTRSNALDDSLRISYCTPTQQEQHTTTQ